MDTRGKYRIADAGVLDHAMRAADMDAAQLSRILASRRAGASCSPQYIRQLRSGQRTRVRADLALAIEAVLLRWCPDGGMFATDDTDTQVSA